ncbi:MAG: four helix bundle protein [Bacteroidales bacterium]|nr:four helix bundle protein [Bacteroidales bacterium]
MAIVKFENLDVWQRARELNKNIFFHFINCKEYFFRDQICRASLSILNNIAEGFERKSKAEFKNYLNYSKGSCGEVRSMLYTALDINLLSKSEFENYLKEVTIVSKLLYGLIRSLDK